MTDTASKIATKDQASLATQSIAELSQALESKRNDLIVAKRSNRAGELANPKIIATYRKEIARLMTQINERKGQ